MIDVDVLNWILVLEQSFEYFHEGLAGVTASESTNSANTQKH